MPDAPNRKVPSLDGLRALAVAAVIFSHSQSLLIRHPPLITFAKRFNQGVDLFFAISGLIITRMLMTELESSGRIRFGAFYIRRAFRILPALGLYLLVLAFLSWVGMLNVAKW